VHEGAANATIIRKPPDVAQAPQVSAKAPAPPRQNISRQERNRQQHRKSVNEKLAAYYEKDLTVIEELNDATIEDWHDKMKERKRALQKRKRESAFIVEKTQMNPVDVDAMSDEKREQEIERLRSKSRAAAIAADNAKRPDRKR